MNVPIVILWYLWRLIISVIIGRQPSWIPLLLQGWALTLGIVVAEVLLLRTGLAHRRISWACIRHAVLILEDDRYASSLGLECLIQSILGIKLNVQIAICGANSSDGSVATSSVGSGQVGSEALLELAVNVDDIFVLIELVFALLGRQILLLARTLMCSSLRLRLVESLIIMLLSPTLAAREGITIRLLRRQSVVSGGVSQGRHFVGWVLKLLLLLGASLMVLIWLIVWLIDWGYWSIGKWVGAVQELRVGGCACLDGVPQFLVQPLLVLSVQEMLEITSTASLTQPRGRWLTVFGLLEIDL